jgi:hypothetical protein
MAAAQPAILPPTMATLESFIAVGAMVVLENWSSTILDVKARENIL